MEEPSFEDIFRWYFVELVRAHVGDQKSFAKKIGKTPTEVSQLLTANTKTKRMVNLRILNKIASGLGKSPVQVIVELASVASRIKDKQIKDYVPYRTQVKRKIKGAAGFTDESQEKLEKAIERKRRLKVVKDNDDDKP